LKITTQHIILGILILTCLSMGWGLGSSCNDSVKYDRIINAYTDSLNKSKVKVEFLETKQLELEVSIVDQNNKIKRQAEEIKKLKKKLDEKVDSIRNLSNKQSIEYLSNWLSKGSNPK